MSDPPTPTNTPVPPPYTVPQSLIDDIKRYRAEQSEGSDHAERWRRALVAFGVESGGDPMSASEAQTYADRGWGRWIAVVDALEKLAGN